MARGPHGMEFVMTKITECLTEQLK